MSRALTQRQKVMDLEKLIASGTQLGLSGGKLRPWIENELALLRVERAAERDARREADERERHLLDRRLRLQEGARNQ